ncbi:MAG: PKD domain-containing protein [Flavisolibacter sp.]
MNHLMKTRGGRLFLLAILSAFTLTANAKKIYITKGSDNGRYINHSTFSYQPGDTLVLKASGNPYSYFSLQGIQGTLLKPIVIINEGGQVQLSSGFGFKDCAFIKLTGSGSGDRYGFKIESPNVSGVGIDISNKSKNVDVSRVEITRKEYGFWIKNESSCDATVNNWVLDNISVSECYIHHTGSQAFYMGSTSPSGTRSIICNGATVYPKPSRLGNIRIFNNIIDFTGRSGIQLSAASGGNNEIYGNTISNSGMQFDAQQGNGILLGGYTRAYIHDNNISNTFASGIFSLGSGLLKIENNRIDKSGTLSGRSANGMAGIMIDTRTTTPPENTEFHIRNNFLGSHTDKHVRVYKTVSTYSTGNLICNNTSTSGVLTIAVQSGINYTTSCGSTPVPANQAPVARAGTDIEITLPVAAATLNGSTSSDADGSITEYSWSKVSGPAVFAIANVNLASISVTGLIEGSYVFRLTVKDNGGSSSSDDITLLVKAPGSVIPSTDRILIDLGSVAMSSPDNSGNSWNQVNDARPGVRISNAKTTSNASSNISLEIINRINGNWDGAGTGIGSGNNIGTVGDYSSNATTDFAIAHKSTASGKWKLSGLVASKTYKIKFWGTRSATGPRIIQIKKSNESAWLEYDAANNKDANRAAVFTNITGVTEATFDIRVKSGSTFGHIGLIDIESSGLVETTVGISSLGQSTAGKVELYPNPAAERTMLKINNEHKGEMKITIVSENGQLKKEFIFNKTQNALQVYLPLHDLPSGSYFTRVQIAEWSDTQTLIRL